MVEAQGSCERMGGYMREITERAEERASGK